jgi:hypothetical protein
MCLTIGAAGVSLWYKIFTKINRTIIIQKYFILIVVQILVDSLEILMKNYKSDGLRLQFFNLSYVIMLLGAQVNN